MEHTIGIDFGTTKTLVSFYDPKRKTKECVRLGRGIDKMSTSIYVDENGVWQFGDDADDYMSLSPLRYRRDFKLWLGKNAPYLVAKVEGTIHRFTAKDLAAKFLKHIKDQCEEMVFHKPVSSCTVTYPVAFSIAQREELRAAALEAGFERVNLLPEPEAAGYAYYAFGADKRLSKLMVVDWGGGTVDFAMVKLEGNEVSLVPNSYGGEVNVGGRKFDELLFTHLSRKIVQNGGTYLEDDGDPQLEKKVCSYKEQLSRVAVVKQILLVGRKGIYPQTEVVRNEFNVIITPVVDRVVDQLKELLAKCTEKPEALLLIGGSTSVPFIRERLEAEIGLKCVVWDKLNEAVSIGAAWYGSQLIDFTDPSPTPGQDQGLPNPKDENAPVVDPASPDMQRKWWKSGSELESYICERKNAHDDFWYFIRSMIVTLWRFNPVRTSRMNFAEEIEKMAENEDSKVKSYRLRQGLAAIDFGDFDELVKNAADFVGYLLKESLRVDDGYIKLYPGLKAVPVGKIPDFDDQALKNDVSMQLSQLKDDYTDICEKYKMLKDGYARYDEITAGRISLLKKAIYGGCLCVLGLAILLLIAILSDSLASVLKSLAIVAWIVLNSWKYWSNDNFIQNYDNALGEFGTTCDDFTNRGQDLLLKTIMQKQDLYGRLFEIEEVYLRALNAEGLDLTEVEKRIDEDEKPQNPQDVMEMSQKYSLALQVLREDAPISESSIQKLVEKLRRGGALLLADGTFDESVQQALVSVDKEAEERMTKFWKIVGKGEDCYDFYIGDDIPPKKLVNALREYATTLRLEDVLCLYDATFFGGGEDGFVITLDGLYWKNNGIPRFRSWDDMKSISIHNGTSDKIMINGVAMEVPSGKDITFVAMFRELRDLLSQKKG